MVRDSSGAEEQSVPESTFGSTERPILARRKMGGLRIK